MSEIGNLIYNRRKQLGLTLEEVGNAVGVSKSTVKKWENGYISNMRSDKIEKLARILQLSPIDLLDIQKGPDYTTATLKKDGIEYKKTEYDSGMTIESHKKLPSLNEHPKPMERPVLSTNEELKFALFDGSEGVTDEMFEEVKQFAAMVKMREDAKKEKK